MLDSVSLAATTTLHPVAKKLIFFFKRDLLKIKKEYSYLERRSVGVPVYNAGSVHLTPGDGCYDGPGWLLNHPGILWRVCGERPLKAINSTGAKKVAPPPSVVCAVAHHAALPPLPRARCFPRHAPVLEISFLLWACRACFHYSPP